jgi:PhoH-like ATPase
LPKTYVLDTNVLLHSPQAIWAFGKNNVVIPEAVLEELDKFKKESNDLGANARHVGRMVDQLRLQGRLTEGVSLENGTIFRVEMNHYTEFIPPTWDRTKPDNRILQVCKGLHTKGEQVVLVTKDIFERIKADVLDVIAEDFREDWVPNIDDQYRGRISIYVPSDLINAFYAEQAVIPPGAITYYPPGRNTPEPVSLEVNQFVILHALDNPKHTALGRYDGRHIVPLYFHRQSPFGVSPRNAGQKFMQEALCMSADKAPLVIVKGPAGTAKTFFALAVGLHKVMECEPREYRKILVCRPNVTMDEDLGYLPGTEQEKIAPLMRPIRDNLQALLDGGDDCSYLNEKQREDKVDEFFDRKIITTEALAFLRGRSIWKHWVIIDEAQNLTPKQVKAIITRAGIGTKIVLIGDPEQIDHPFLDARSNGLSYASEKMKGSSLCYQITMNSDECERSALAAEGAQRL